MPRRPKRKVTTTHPPILSSQKEDEFYDVMEEQEGFVWPEGQVRWSLWDGLPDAIKSSMENVGSGMSGAKVKIIKKFEELATTTMGEIIIEMLDPNERMQPKDFVDDFLTMEEAQAAWEIVKEKEREWVVENLSLYAMQILPGCPLWIQNWAKTLLEKKDEFKDEIKEKVKEMKIDSIQEMLQELTNENKNKVKSRAKKTKKKTKKKKNSKKKKISKKKTKKKTKKR